MTEQLWKRGDKVNYSKSWSGGYGWNRTFPAVVISVGEKTVRIRRIKWDNDKKLHIVITQCVKPEKLSPRDAVCELESLLTEKHDE